MNCTVLTNRTVVLLHTASTQTRHGRQRKKMRLYTSLKQRLSQTGSSALAAHVRKVLQENIL